MVIFVWGRWLIARDGMHGVVISVHACSLSGKHSSAAAAGVPLALRAGCLQPARCLKIKKQLASTRAADAAERAAKNCHCIRRYQGVPAGVACGSHVRRVTAAHVFGSLLTNGRGAGASPMGQAVAGIGLVMHVSTAAGATSRARCSRAVARCCSSCSM